MKRPPTLTDLREPASIDHDVEVRSLTTGYGYIVLIAGAVHQLHQPVGSSLLGAADVGRAVGCQERPKRRVDDGRCLGVQQTVDGCHAVHERRHNQIPAVELALGVRERSVWVDDLRQVLCCYLDSGDRGNLGKVGEQRNGVLSPIEVKSSGTPINGTEMLVGE